MKKPTKVKRIPFPEFKKIYSRVPRLCVEVIIIENSSLLLIKRSIEPAIGKWHTPGGTVLKGEDLEQAVKRVAKEELDLEVDVIELIGAIEYKSYKNHYSQDISLAFMVKSIDKNFINKIQLDGHADEYSFFPKLPNDMIIDQKKFYSNALGIK